jgi:hypothetical protein
VRFSKNELIMYTANIDQVHTGVLRELLQTCKIALNDTLLREAGKCGSKLCPVTQLGILVKSLRTAGLYPLPDNECVMQCSILTYWVSMRNIGYIYKGYLPESCGKPKTDTVSTYSHSGSHTFVTSGCFGDFGIKDKGREILKRYAHHEVWKQWETVCMRILNCLLWLTSA